MKFNINSLRNAIHIQDRIGKNWFTIERVLKKTIIKNREEASLIITDLIVRGVLTYKVEDKRRKTKGKLVYKVNPLKILDMVKQI